MVYVLFKEMQWQVSNILLLRLSSWISWCGQWQFPKRHAAVLLTACDLCAAWAIPLPDWMQFVGIKYLLATMQAHKGMYWQLKQHVCCPRHTIYCKLSLRMVPNPKKSIQSHFEKRSSGRNIICLSDVYSNTCCEVDPYIPLFALWTGRIFMVHWFMLHYQ